MLGLCHSITQAQISHQIAHLALQLSVGRCPVDGGVLKQTRDSSSLYPSAWHSAWHILGPQYKLVELMLMEREGMMWAKAWRQDQPLLDGMQQV